ncbi:MAG: hypothetical protein LBN27_11155 [Prevotellaceae bacterium]|jgi:uncharacterized membrane protein|nr:hypothetical protein [Prevotellaceae bacterium]
MGANETAKYLNTLIQDVNKQPVLVRLLLSNNGITIAEGRDIRFYDIYRAMKRNDKFLETLYSQLYDDKNTANAFDWTKIIGIAGGALSGAYNTINPADNGDAALLDYLKEKDSKEKAASASEAKSNKGLYIGLGVGAFVLVVIIVIVVFAKRKK